MPKFAANLSMLFTELDFLDRFAAAADAGFKGVEYLFPYDHDPDVLARLLDRHGLQQVLFNLSAGDWAAGDRGMAIFPQTQAAFHQSVADARRYAKALQCPRVHCLAGIVPTGAGERTYRQTYIDNLAYAADALAADGISLLIEPINTRDIPGYFLNTTAKGLDIIDTVGAANLALQYDIYHMQIMEGDLAPTLSRHIDRIAHVQIADTPGRNEPGSGEINFPFLFDHLDRIGYDGWVGCEYRPKTTTDASLAWFRRYQSQRGAS